ncbi:MAG TPA: hypothetical protein VEB21_11685 [Terriglobales bacterium]|nr:hypothetical protein [Terriglobales bacterium]
MNDPARLLRAIQDLNRLDVEPIECVHVREEFRGEVIIKLMMDTPHVVPELQHDAAGRMGAIFAARVEALE